jgi:hypothetical protein
VAMGVVLPAPNLDMSISYMESCTVQLFSIVYRHRNEALVCGHKSCTVQHFNRISPQKLYGTTFPMVYRHRNEALVCGHKSCTVQHFNRISPQKLYGTTFKMCAPINVALACRHKSCTVQLFQWYIVIEMRPWHVAIKVVRYNFSIGYRHKSCTVQL